MKNIRLKESNNNLAEKVKEAIKTLKSIDSDVFYTALGIYEWTGETEPSEEVCQEVYDYLDKVDTVYDEYIRGEVQDLVGHGFDESCDVKECNVIEGNGEDCFWKEKETKTEPIKEEELKLSKPHHGIAKKIINK